MYSNYRMSLEFECCKHVWSSNSLIFEWWSEKRTKNVCFMVKMVQFLNGPPNHVIRPFENQTKKVSKKSKFWSSGVWYSGGYCTFKIWTICKPNNVWPDLSRLRMVTVLQNLTRTAFFLTATGSPWSFDVNSSNNLVRRIIKLFFSWNSGKFG